MYPRIALLALALTVATACGKNPAEPKPLDLTGTWSYSGSNFTGDGLVCTFSGKLLHLAQSGTALTGRPELTQSVRMECSPLGGVAAGWMPAMSHVADLEGSISGDRVVIEESLQGSSGEAFYWKSEGTISGSGDAITGTLTARDYVDSGVRTFTGQFTAVRQK